MALRLDPGDSLSIVDLLFEEVEEHLMDVIFRTVVQHVGELISSGPTISFDFDDVSI